MGSLGRGWTAVSYLRRNDDNNRFENIKNALATIAKNGAPSPFPG
jgi:hypothetical protein